MIDWLFEFALSRNEDWGPVTITQLLFTVHKRAGSRNPFLTLSLCHVRANKSFVHIIIDLKVPQPLLSRHCKRDLTWQIRLIFKIHLLSKGIWLGSGRKGWDETQKCFWMIPPGACQDYQVVLHGNGNQVELGYCTGDVHVAAVAGFALSDATQQNRIPAPKAICQSKNGEDTERKDEVKAKNCSCPWIRTGNQDDET